MRDRPDHSAVMSRVFAASLRIGFAVAVAASIWACDPCASCSTKKVMPTPTASPTATVSATPTASATSTRTGTPTATPTATATPIAESVGSGLFAVDCKNLLAYVPLLNSNDPASGNGRVSVLDLSVNPNSKDPRKTTVILTHADSPTGTALDPIDHLIIVVSGSSGTGGFVDVINESTNQFVSGSPFTMPAGTEPGFTGQVLFDPVHGKAIISVEEISGCPVAGTCTGFVTFDPVAHSFGSVISANYAETFAFNPSTGQVVDASDSDSAGQIGIVDISTPKACTLEDSNIGGDNDGSAIDPFTDIAVVSNEDGTATVINLNGSTLVTNPTPPPACLVQEGGTNPNSVFVDGLPGSTAGSAINPTTHQAFLIEDGSSGISLLSLPQAPVVQMPSALPTPSISSIPNDPNGCVWQTQGDPYAVAVCNNSGYAVDLSPATFLVQIDLTAFENNPAAIASPLPSGQCFNTNSPFGCNNNLGVVFFPLPPDAEITPSCIVPTATPTATPGP